MRRLALLFAALLVAGVGEKLSGETQRVWTRADGKKLTGTLEGQGEGWVKLKIKDKVYKVKFEKLSQADQDYLRTQKQSAKRKPGPGEQYTWKIGTIDNGGVVDTSPSLAFSRSGQPAISYYDGSSRALRYASFDGFNWITETIAREGDVGDSTSLAFTPSGQPAISYYDLTNKDLKYASFDGRKWTSQTVDSEGRVGWFNSLSFSPSGHPAISYHQYPNELKYASFNGRKWTTEAIDSEGGSPAANTSLKHGPDGQQAISYSDESNKDLKYASFDGRKWTSQTIDSEGRVGSFTSLAFRASGQPAISYCDFRDLKYASYDGRRWTTRTIERAGQIGGYTSLAFSPLGQPGIAYVDKFSGDLKYAYEVIVKKEGAVLKSTSENAEK